MAEVSDEEIVPLGDETPDSSESNNARVPAGRYSASGYSSILTEERLSNLRERYRVPDSVSFRLPGRGETADAPPPGCVAFYEYFFKVGVRLPLHPFIRNFLRLYKIAPGQLIVND